MFICTRIYITFKPKQDLFVLQALDKASAIEVIILELCVVRGKGVLK